MKTRRYRPEIRLRNSLLPAILTCVSIYSVNFTTPCLAESGERYPTGPSAEQEEAIQQIIMNGPRTELHGDELVKIQKKADAGDPVAITRLCYHHISRGEGKECSTIDRREAYSNRLTYASLYGAKLFRCAKRREETFEGLFWLIYGAEARDDSDQMARLVLAKAFLFGVYGVPRIPELAEFLLKYRRGGRKVADSTVKNMIAKLNAMGPDPALGECGRSDVHWPSVSE